VLIGEIYLPVEKLVRYYGEEMRGAHLPFNFQLILAPWDARHIAQLIDEYEAALPEGGWPNWVLGNHDQHRIASRVGAEQARVAAMLLLTLRGTPTVYYGDELGMHDVDIPADRVQDPYEKNVPGRGLGRDPERTPMQWCAEPNAGFSVAEPWLPLPGDFEQVNVEAQRDDPESMLSFFHRLVELRRGSPALEVGGFKPVAAHGDVLAYVRENEEERFLVLLNLGGKPHDVDRGENARAGRVAVATRRSREGEEVGRYFHLEPNDGVVIRLASR
jgi:alpha-glucosidase